MKNPVQILDADVEWYHGYANTPGIKLLLSRTFDFDVARYEERDCLYLAQDGVLVDFYFYSRPGDGYGGRHFELTMIDGSKRTLKGPWSSNSQAVGEKFNVELMEVSYTDNPKSFERGYTFTAGAALVSAIKELALPILQKKYPGLELFKSRGFFTVGIRDGDAYYKAPNPNPRRPDQEIQKICDVSATNTKTRTLNDASSEQAQIILG